MKLTYTHRAHRRGAIILVLVSSLAGLALATATSSSAADGSNKQLKKVNDESHQHDLQVSPTERRDIKNSLEQTGSASAVASVTAASPKNQKDSPSAIEESAAVVAAEKKQGDFIIESAAADIFNSEEYVQIKPEEPGTNENGRETSSPTSDGSQASPVDRQILAAEHKSSAGDDELNALLAQDTIKQLESAQNYAHAYSSLAVQQPGVAAPRAFSPGGYQQQAKLSGPMAHAHSQTTRGNHYSKQMHAGGGGQHGPAQVGYHGPGMHHSRGTRGPSSQPRLPPSYVAQKGKLTGINSLVSQYPHPAPGYPHHGPRHLPRGAAAGYAAFRDFVRAHASKYKPMGGLAQASMPMPPVHPMAPMQQPGYSGTPAGGYAEQQHSGPKYEAGPPAQAQAHSYGPPAKEYMRPEQAPQASGYGGAGAAEPYHGQQQKRTQSRTRVTVAQAYIPHLADTSAQAAGGSYGSGSVSSSSSSSPPAYNSQQMNLYTSKVLPKLYGANAPQGAGRPEYSKDFGVVIHYPQATVYTEPMTVEQLHKLAGSGISQLLDQLQYNLANGHRDESNTIRANNRHHIGNGLTIHAKEYYAPGKGGQYIPTTAAVISSVSGAEKGYGEAGASEPASPSAGYKSGAAAAGALLDQSAYSSMSGPRAQELGSGYERVKQVATHSGDSYETSSSGGGANKYNGGGSGNSLAAITNLIGAELDAVYKANKPLKYSRVQGPMSPLAGLYAPAGPTRTNGMKYGGSPRHQRGPHGHRHGGESRGRGARKGVDPHGQHNQNRYHGKQPQMSHHRPQQHRPQRYHQNRPHQNYYQSQQQQQPHQQLQQSASYRQPNGQMGAAGQSYGHAHPMPQQPQPQPQQQSYQQPAHQAAEQAMNQQMLQLLHEIEVGDDQYNNKNNPLTKINHRAYPVKIVQKYQQQQSAYQQPQQQAAGAHGEGHQQQLQSAYAQHESMEIPQGPNDQIGEIADLIEALKGALESGKQDGVYDSTGKQASKDDVRYLTNTLGQAPSYAMQVPVNTGAVGKSEDNTGYGNSGKKGTAEAISGAYQAPAGAPQHYQQQQGELTYQQAGAGEHQAARYQQQQPAAADYQQQQSAAALSAYAQAPAPAAGQNEPASYGMQSQQQQQPQADYQSQEQYNQQQTAYQQQQPAAQGDYQQQSAGQQQQLTVAVAPVANGYGLGGTPTAPAAQNVISGVYPQAAHQQQQAGQQQQQQAQAQAPGGFSSSKHSQIINHLVPVASHQQAAPSSSGDSGYGDSSSSARQHQPANQIALEGPTDSQYQQAQPLSSFVDSLPSDYQDLLRQPVLIDDHSGPLALLDHATNGDADNSNSNAYSAGSSQASSAAGALAHAATSSSNNYDLLSSSASSTSSMHQLVPSSSQKASSSASSSSSSSPASPSAAASSPSSSSSASSSAASSSYQQPQAKGQSTSGSSQQ